MNIVREHIIFEKFTEDSDPIHDMGIGYDFLRKLKKGTIAIAKKDINLSIIEDNKLYHTYAITLNRHNFYGKIHAGWCMVVVDDIKIFPKLFKVKFLGFSTVKQAKNASKIESVYKNSGFGILKIKYDEWKTNFNIIE
jgi:hypothetical protein